MRNGLFNRACGPSDSGSNRNLGSRDDTVVRALASHQCGPDSIPGLGVICGLSLLLVLCEVFFWVVRFSLLLKNEHFQISSSLVNILYAVPVLNLLHMTLVLYQSYVLMID